VLLTGVEEPNLWIDVADTFETGLASILAHVSQVEPDEVSERMRERARVIGEPQGFALAQAFLSIILECHVVAAEARDGLGRSASRRSRI
jgi:LmbE family N-acetylglucosaminyl deacetylase